jgi:hypothetical protein
MGVITQFYFLFALILKIFFISFKHFFTLLSYKELVEKTYFFKEDKKELCSMIANFIKIAKSNLFKLD